MRPDLSPLVGWETGRASEPAFMDMNLRAVRNEKSEPRVVLYQFDVADPMNPHGLLVAYAEGRVAPVVSDFDTFTIGSKGMKYQPTPPMQLDLVHWSLDQTSTLLQNTGRGKVRAARGPRERSNQRAARGRASIDRRSNASQIG